MKKVYQDDVVENLLRKFNPFGLRSKQGIPFEFMKTTEVYLHVMVVLLVTFPRGYIELPLLLSTLYSHLTFKECKDYAESMGSMGVEQLALIDYEGKDGKQYIERFCRALHSICETPFDGNSFAEAYRLFLNRIEIQKLKSNEQKES